jgi:uncharacterized protein YukE
MDLEFNIDKLAETERKFTDLADELALLKKDVISDLDRLQKDWKTPAGKKFFSNQVKDWPSHVDKYVEITNTIATMLNYAIQKYQNVEDEAKKISF